MKKLSVVVSVIFAGCTGTVHSPPVVLLPIIVPIALVERIRHPPKPPVYQPLPGGESSAHPLMIEGKFIERDLQSYLTYFFWTDHNYRIPGTAQSRYVVTETPRKVEAVIYRDNESKKDFTYFFDLTQITLIPKPPQ